MLCGALKLTAGAEELAEAHVAVDEVGELVEELVTQALSLVELTGVDQVDGVVGHLVDSLVLVDDGSPAGGRSESRR